MIRRIFTLLLVAVAALTAFASPAWAHNALVATDPADGAVLDVAPAQIVFTFKKSVPLETMSAELVDGSGIRSDLNGLQHGAAGDTEVVVPLPALSGAVTVRWRLVGADGHPITGRVALTVNAPPPTAAPTAAAPTAAAPIATATQPIAVAPGVDPSAAPAVDPNAVPAADPNGSPAPTVDPNALPAADPNAAPASAVDPNVLPVPAATPNGVTVSTTATSAGSGAAGDPADAGATAAVNDEATGTPAVVRWFARLLSYVAIAVLIGAAATTKYVWSDAADHPALARMLRWAATAVAVLALFQLLVIAADIKGTSVFSALSGLSGALKTSAGVGLMFRAILAVALLGVLAMQTLEPQARLAAIGGMSLLLLVTWAWAGHSRTQRWPLIGVPLDIAHHAGAAAWLGAIAILGLVAIKEASTEELVGSVQRFAAFAPLCVGVLIGTGVLQLFRLVGSPFNLFDATHGRLLLLKLAVLAVMLWVANVNRQRVAKRFAKVQSAGARATGMLRRAMVTELALGLVILAITAAMVVSPPASAGSEAADSSGSSPATAEADTSTTIAAVFVATAPTVPVATTPTLAPCKVAATLEVGSAGDEVTCLQQTLISLGLLVGPPTGSFDATTETAVKAFQEANALLADGIAGPKTNAKLGIGA